MDNEPDAGLLGVLGTVSAREASTPISPPDPATVAGHAGHLLYAMKLANRAAGGEDAYADADWSGSWNTDPVTDAEWSALLSALRRECDAFRDLIVSGLPNIDAK